MTQSTPLSADEQSQLEDLLNRTNWPLTPGIFNAALGLMPTVAFELVVIAETNFNRQKRLCVLLLPRPDNDPFFAGLVHGAGTVMRRGDTETTALKRACKELGAPSSITKPRFVGVEHVPMGPLPMNCPRGQEIGILYYCKWRRTTTPDGIIYADVENLPDNVIGFHRNLIARAVAQYKKDKKKNRKK